MPWGGVRLNVWSHRNPAKSPQRLPEEQSDRIKYPPPRANPYPEKGKASVTHWFYAHCRSPLRGWSSYEDYSLLLGAADRVFPSAKVLEAPVFSTGSVPAKNSWLWGIAWDPSSLFKYSRYRNFSRALGTDTRLPSLSSRSTAGSHLARSIHQTEAPCLSYSPRARIHPLTSVGSHQHRSEPGEAGIRPLNRRAC